MAQKLCIAQSSFKDSIALSSSIRGAFQKQCAGRYWFLAGSAAGAKEEREKVRAIIADVNREVDITAKSDAEAAYGSTVCAEIERRIRRARRGDCPNTRES